MGMPGCSGGRCCMGVPGCAGGRCCMGGPKGERCGACPKEELGMVKRPCDVGGPCDTIV